MSTVKIKLGKNATDSEVLVDGEPLGCVRAVDVHGAVHERTTATIKVLPDEVIAKANADDLKVVQRLKGDEGDE